MIIEGKDLENEQLKEQIEYMKYALEIQSDANAINLIEAKKEIQELKSTVNSNKIEPKLPANKTEEQIKKRISTMTKDLI